MSTGICNCDNRYFGEQCECNFFLKYLKNETGEIFFFLPQIFFVWIIVVEMVNVIKKLGSVIVVNLTVVLIVAVIIILYTCVLCILTKKLFNF